MPEEVRAALAQLMRDAYQAGLVDLAAEVQALSHRLAVIYKRIREAERAVDGP